MGMQDILTETKFGMNVAISQYEIERFNGTEADKFIEYKLGRAAESLGRLIMEKKRWNSSQILPYGAGIGYDTTLIVFHPNELMDYMEAKFKTKLQHMAATEEFLTEDQRKAVMTLSERF